MSHTRNELREAGYLVRIVVGDRDRKREIEAVTFKALLMLAHEGGLRATETQLVQMPSKANGEVAIVHATVSVAKGTFTALGDASPENVSPEVAPHIVRVAETRALARALRIAVNIGEVAVEELARFEWVRSSDNRASEKPSGPPSPPAKEPDRPAPHAERPARFRGRDSRPTETRAGDDKLAMSEEQRRLLFRLAYDLVRKDKAAALLLERLGVARFEQATLTSCCP